MLTNLGNQYSYRKVEPPSQQPGTSAGTVTHTVKGVLGMVSQEKWEINQRLIKEVREMLEDGTKIYRPIL